MRTTPWPSRTETSPLAFLLNSFRSASRIENIFFFFFLQQYSNIISESQNTMIYNWGREVLPDVCFHNGSSHHRVMSCLWSGTPQIQSQDFSLLCMCDFFWAIYVNSLAEAQRYSLWMSAVSSSCQPAAASLCTATIKGYYRSMFSSVTCIYEPNSQWAKFISSLTETWVWQYKCAFNCFVHLFSICSVKSEWAFLYKIKRFIYLEFSDLQLEIL